MGSSQPSPASKPKDDSTTPRKTPTTTRLPTQRPPLKSPPVTLSPRVDALFSTSQPFLGAVSLAPKDSERTNTGKPPSAPKRPSGNEDSMSAPFSPPNSSGQNLEKLREAVKTIQSSKFRPSLPGTLSAKSSMRKAIATGTIEQQAMSPSLEAAFGSPLTTGAETMSSESTESAKTIRGTAASTPGQIPLRTPSYPFPYVPSRVSSGLNFPMHQPFTALSPTVSSSEITTRAHPRDKYSASSQSTPLGGPSYFGPQSSNVAFAGASSGFNEPNLYEVVLQLNSDPNLNAWWNTLTTVLREHYKIDRASLALPADVTDIENVPWGQKANYNVYGLESQSSAARSTNRSVSISSETSKSTSSRKSEATNESFSVPGVRPTLARPLIESRHSFAGYEYSQHPDITEPSRSPNIAVRPIALRRTTAHAASALPRSSVNEDQRASERQAPIYEHVSDEHVEHGDGQDGSLPQEELYACILPTLKALDREKDALLDSGGVNRVLERGRLVTLTRDYSTDPERKGNVTGGLQDPTAPPYQMNHPGQEVNALPSAFRATGQPQFKTRIAGRVPLFNRAPLDHSAGVQRAGIENQFYYEDYEQFPASSWSQSPAPSPAIQKDAETNPFFASGNLDEDSFSPTPTTQDYSGFGQVEAIGVDRAATIVHIPLIHPLLSRTLNLRSDDSNISAKEEPRSGIARDPQHTSQDRKAPVAILSVLSPDVPYPQTLLHSLKTLSPHLATSFHTSLQNTNLQERIVGALHRQQQSGRSGGLVPFPSGGLDIGLGFESLLRFDPDDTRSSTVDSVTSPSDYSGRSRHSPIGSVVCTPGIDPLMHTTASRHPTGTTPGHISGSEPTENYFEVKKRTALSRSRSGGPITQTQLTAQHTGRPASTEHRSALRKIETSPVAKDRPGTPGKRGESRKARVKDEPSPMRIRSRTAKNEGDENRHTVLHSHGADFSASFQSLPVAAMPRTPGVHHTRSSSLSDSFDMPPPSERLLRTIIDSLPVQIFTAAPSSGRVTWVNSKFLVYRGQTPKQVIEDPWETIHPEDLDEYTSDWHRSLHTGQQFQHKIRLRRFDDNYRWYYVRAAPLRDKLQNIVHWVGTMIDLHDQHLAELNAARQQVSIFIVKPCHDLTVIGNCSI